MTNKRFLLLPVLCFLTSILPAHGNGDDESPEPRIITGIIRLVGNEPFTELVITDAAGQDYLIPKKSAFDFHSLVQQTITIRSRVGHDEIRTADGKYIGERLTLINPEIVRN